MKKNDFLKNEKKTLNFPVVKIYALNPTNCQHQSLFYENIVTVVRRQNVLYFKTPNRP